MMSSKKTRFPIGRLLRHLHNRKSALIYTHDNPDPDSLASAWGLARLFASELSIPVTIAHGGIVGRAQNRAMVETLGIELTLTENLRPERFDLIALVDSQPETGNNSLPANHRIDVVIDHHPARNDSRRAPWCDVRPELGATCTIILEYLKMRGIEVDVALATAFFFALRTETRDLGREATEQERHAYLALVPLVDHALLYRMTHPKVTRAHFCTLDRALRQAQVYKSIVAVNLGELGYPDLVAEIADLLLAFESAKSVLCAGLYEGSAYLSLRSEPPRRRSGTIMRAIVGDAGAAGGHGTMAGARLFGKFSSVEALDVEFKSLVARLHEAVGDDIAEPSALLTPDSDCPPRITASKAASSRR